MNICDSDRVSKLEEPEVLTKLLSNDIFCLSETHCNDVDTFSVKGFKLFQSVRPKTKTAKKHFGGLLVGVRDELRPGISFLSETECTDFVWVKLSKTFFRIERDIFIAFVYIPPANSVVHRNQDYWQILGNSLTDYLNQGHCAVIGDCNARTFNLPDFVVGDDSRFLGQLDIDDLPYICDEGDIIRSTLDCHQVDEFGNNLLNLCKDSRMRILNGRIIGDLSGKFTCFSRQHEPSVIDYALASSDLFPFVEQFSVGPLEWLSIHCPLNLKLKVPFTPSFDNSVNMERFPMYKLPARSRVSYSHKLNTTPKFRHTAANVVFASSRGPYEESSASLDSAVSDVTGIYLEAARLTKLELKNKSNSQNSRPKPKDREWFDRECRIARWHMTRKGRILNNPVNRFSRRANAEFYAASKRYRSIRRKAKSNFLANLYKQLESLESRDPKQFWALYKKVSGVDTSPAPNPIDPCDWVAHFRDLLNSPLTVDPDHKGFIDSFHLNFSPNIDIVNDILNKAISLDELDDRLTSAKDEKTPNTDFILNEMLKCSPDYLKHAILVLFNRILSSGIFPSSWRVNTLSPLHKKGDANICGNYRGIAIASNLAKLFLSILHKRLQTLINLNALIPVEQIGFKKGARTADYILTLTTLISKYLHSNPSRRLFATFVDFKSAYDTVWRKALLYKLNSMSIKGNFLKLLDSMYADVRYRIKLAGALSPEISSEIAILIWPWWGGVDRSRLE